MFSCKWILLNDMDAKHSKKFNPLIWKKLMSQNGSIVSARKYILQFVYIHIFYSYFTSYSFCYPKEANYCRCGAYSLLDWLVIFTVPK